MTTPPPEVGPATTLVYRGLPELYRDADVAQSEGPSGYPLLRYLALLLDQLTPLVELLDRLNYPARDEAFDLAVSGTYDGAGGYGFGDYDTPSADTLTVAVWPTEDPASDLVDPDRADGRWLPWLCQLVGVDATGITTAQLRDRLHHLDFWQRHGSGIILTALIREALGLDPYDLETGEQYLSTGEYGGPSEWDEDVQEFVICLHYSGAGYADDTVDAAVLAHVARERPAGFVFTLGDN